jgi:hypothetical protein
MLDIPAELDYLARLLAEVNGLPRLRVAKNPEDLIRTEIEPMIFARVVFLLLMVLGPSAHRQGRPPRVKVRVTHEQGWCHVDFHRLGTAAAKTLPDVTQPLYLARRIVEAQRGQLTARAGEKRGPAKIRLTLRAERGGSSSSKLAAGP